MVSIKFWRGKFSRPATGYECIAHALAFDRGVAPVRPFTLSEHRSLFAAQVFRWGSTVYRFLFLSTISSTSSDSEMSFDSEDSEIYYIAEENEDSHSSTSQSE